MRLPFPSRWILRRARRLAGCAADRAIARIRLLPRRIEIHALGQGAVHVVPIGWRALLLLVLAPLFHVVIAGGRARLHVRVGGLPYSLDALLFRRRFAALAPARAPLPVDYERSAA
jgi:hypothetical protein